MNPAEPLHVLFVSASLPPQWDSQTIRSLYLLTNADPAKIRFTFLSPGPPGREHPCAHLVPKDTRTVLTPPPPIPQRVEWVKKHLGARPAWIVSNILYRTAFPDTASRWQDIAHPIALQTHAEDPAHLVLSASGSATAHILAAALAQELNLPWVADYGDPWSILDRKHRPLAALLSVPVEKSILRHCHHLVFTTQATLRAYQDWLKSQLPPASVIPYGFLPKDSEAAGPANPDPHRRKTIAHIGVAFRGNRDLTPLIRALATQDQNFRLEVVGNHSPAFQTAAQPLTDPLFQQRVPYQQAQQATARADILVVIGNKAPLQIPGKTFVCAGSKKVVLYIGQRPPGQDPSRQVLAHLPGVVACLNETAQIADALQQIQNRWPDLQTAANDRPNHPEVQALAAPALSRLFLDLLHQAHQAHQAHKPRPKPKNTPN